ncbi:MAG: hypothetical protein ACI90V_013550 [Bacillariaceae sp.]|jgi:hypothetical protein
MDCNRFAVVLCKVKLKLGWLICDEGDTTSVESIEMKIQMDGCVVKIRTLLNKRRYMVHVIVFFWRDNIRRTHSIISIIDHNLYHPSSFIQQAQRNNNNNMATIRARELYNDIIED